MEKPRNPFTLGCFFAFFRDKNPLPPFFNVFKRPLTQHWTKVVCAVSLPKPGALITANANAVLQFLDGSKLEEIHSLKLTFSPMKIGRLTPRKEAGSSSNHPFSDAKLLLYSFRECIQVYSHIFFVAEIHSAEIVVDVGCNNVLSNLRKCTF